MRRVLSVFAVLIVMTTLVVGGGGAADAKVAGVNGQIAFSRYDPAVDDSHTYTANPDGTNVRELLPGYTSGSPHWSPDGRFVAVTSGLDVPCPPTCTGNTVIIDSDTHAVVRVLPSTGFPTVGTWCSIRSPDATRFLCEGSNDDDPTVNGVYSIRSSDGGDLTRITYPANGDDIPIDWSPDGSQIVYGHTGQFHTCDTQSALFVANADGSGEHQITPWGFCDDDGSWSPDGNRIAFVTSGIMSPSGRGGSNGAVFTVRPDGSDLTRIPLTQVLDGSKGRTYAGDVSWSPDGSRIVFPLGVRTGDGGQEGIVTANAERRSGRPLGYDYRDTTWIAAACLYDPKHGRSTAG